ncbi:MAG: hypothetical protein WCH39_29930 [Schlesneria sp.]
MADKLLTLQELAKRIEGDYSGVVIPQWKLRRVVDSLNNKGSIVIQRFGLCRAVSSECVTTVADELRRIGWMDTPDAAASGDSDVSEDRTLNQRAKHSRVNRLKPSPSVGAVSGKGRGSRKKDFARQ